MDLVIASRLHIFGLELRSVDANYPFDRSHRFPGILHSMLQPREDRCNFILELQTPLLEPCENLVGGRLFPRLDAIDVSVDFVVALRESPELIIGSYHPLDKRDLLRKLISYFMWALIPRRSLT